MKPLYIWAGGKNKMISKYLQEPSIPYSGYDTFCEPFFGGGAMMIHIYKNNPSCKRFIINDINKEIMGIYSAIKYDVHGFIYRMDELQQQYLPLSKEDRKVFYYALREQYGTNWKQWTPTEESATLYFLMKTGFNGIWQTNKQSNGRFGTPSGLLNQTDTVYDKANVLEWNVFLKKATLYSGDWKKCTKYTEGKTFFFMDPPYRGSFTSYDQTFNDDQQVELIEFCVNRSLAGDAVMYCNRDVGDDFYIQHKAHLDISYYDVTYTAGRRKQTKEEDGSISHSAKKAKEILLHSNVRTSRNILDL